ncbi:MAG: M42 family peptidase, partial [Bacillota bacterium]|nr:M42 family peptidase [Bacillota bacterium]
MLEKLIRLYGPSSHENSVADFIENELQGLAEVKRDCMGNIIAHIPGEGKKIMLAAHMDEIGIMVTFIDDNGFLRFAPVGGLAKFAILYTRVKFPSGKVGVISYPEKTEAKNLKISDMYIDIGASSREEAEKFVSIGDMAEFDSTYYTDGNIITSGKLDDRLGCYILIELAKRVKKPFCDLYLAFTVQEEIGLRGAVTATFGVEPDIAVAVDVTDTGDTPG